MDLETELNTGSLSASPHAVIPLQPEGHDDTARRYLHLSTHCLTNRLPRALELLARRLRGNDWADQTRIATLLAGDAAGQWSANALSHDGELDDFWTALPHSARAQMDVLLAVVCLMLVGSPSLCDASSRSQHLLIGASVRVVGWRGTGGFCAPSGCASPH